VLVVFPAIAGFLGGALLALPLRRRPIALATVGLAAPLAWLVLAAAARFSTDCPSGTSECNPMFWPFMAIFAVGGWVAGVIVVGLSHAAATRRNGGRRSAPSDSLPAG
jgi:hypothetical protein